MPSLEAELKNSEFIAKSQQLNAYMKINQESQEIYFGGLDATKTLFDFKSTKSGSSAKADIILKHFVTSLIEISKLRIEFA